MKKILVQFAALILCVSLCVPAAFAARRYETVLQVGLAFDSGALTAANLENSTGYGAGYRFGYFDEDLDFEELGYTSKRETQITMLRASEIYLSGSSYSTDRPSGRYETIGCYHVVLGYYRDFEDALEEAEQYDDGFVAWINGEYQAREGAYTTMDEALDAADELDGEDVKGTSSYAVNVVETGTTRILFQFDAGSSLALGVMPDVTGEDEVRTWFKGYRYHGGFRYERIDGGNLTVVNIVDLETYVKGVLPYEMKNTWPLEALKAQAVCARSYAYNKIQEHGHSGSHFDICNTEHCQMYCGVGSGNADYQATELTDQAVEETEGMYALYQGEPIIAYYSSSHGGGSERIDNVWNTKYLPYLCGVIDPYEEKVASINGNSSWTKTVTAAEMLQRLQANGFGLGNSIDSLELTYSPTGNVIQTRVIFTNGKSSTFTPRMNPFGMYMLWNSPKSLHFTVNGEGASSGSAVQDYGGTVKVNETASLDIQQRVYAISGKGNVKRVDTEELYTISGSGSVDELDISSGGSSGATSPTGTVVTVTGSTFVLEGSGSGHNLGMSQYGAYAMAQEGFTYDEIVEFYYPGVEVEEYY